MAAMLWMYPQQRDSHNSLTRNVALLRTPRLVEPAPAMPIPRFGPGRTRE